MNIKLLIGVLILVLATCSIYSPTPRGSGIEGQVFLGPMCPVVQVGQECPDQPYQATLTVNSPNGGKIVQAQADAQGRDRASVQRGSSPPGAHGVGAREQQVYCWAVEVLISAGNLEGFDLHFHLAPDPG